MLKYNYKINMNEDSTASRLIKLVGKNLRVLEIGTSAGYMSQILKEEFGCKVYGIEIDAESARFAEPHLEKLVIANIENSEWRLEFEENFFDVILIADVLEHTINPKAVLESLGKFLKTNGKVILSVPNFSYIGVLLTLMHGKFFYNETGILDNTHLQIFSRTNLIDLIERSGFRIVHLDSMKKSLIESEFSTELSEIPKEVIQFLFDKNPDILTYQFIAVLELGEEKVNHPLSYSDADKFISEESFKIQGLKNQIDILNIANNEYHDLIGSYYNLMKSGEDLRENYFNLNKSAQEVSEWALALNLENQDLKAKIALLEESFVEKIKRLYKK